eukprot:7389276-Prymnesium_polylepis.1
MRSVRRWWRTTDRHRRAREHGMMRAWSMHVRRLRFSWLAHLVRLLGPGAGSQEGYTPRQPKKRS